MKVKLTGGIERFTVHEKRSGEQCLGSLSLQGYGVMSKVVVCCFAGNLEGLMEGGVPPSLGFLEPVG